MGNVAFHTDDQFLGLHARRSLSIYFRKMLHPREINSQGLQSAKVEWLSLRNSISFGKVKMRDLVVLLIVRWPENIVEISEI